MKETTRYEFTLPPHPQYQTLVEWLESLPEGAVICRINEAARVLDENRYWRWKSTSEKFVKEKNKCWRNKETSIMHTSETLAWSIVQATTHSCRNVTLNLLSGKNEENKQKRPLMLLGQKITTHEELESLPVGSVLISHIRQSKRLHHVFSVKKGNNAWETGDAELEPDRHMQGLIGCCDTYLHELPEQEEH